MRKITLGLLSIFWLPSLALASTNMVVDDATIVDPQSCEIESWFGDNGRDSLFYFAPVCQFGAVVVTMPYSSHSASAHVAGKQELKEKRQ